MSIAGLRTSDPATLLVLTQDALTLPLGQIEPGTLLDLLALSEFTTGLSADLMRDLSNFQTQMFREIDDLPDGVALATFVQEIAANDAADIPASLREHLAGLLEDRRAPESMDALQELAQVLEGTIPIEVSLPEAATKTAETKAAAPVKKRTRVTASQVDPERAEWIEEDVLSRLKNYGNRGLKESIILAGARHRAAWADLTGAEILAVMRRLKRESKVRYSAGRWMIS